MQYVRNTFGIALLLCLWAIAAVFIAPAVERALQSQARALLSELDQPVEAEADGLRVLISGQVDSMEERYAVFEQLKPMHPLARIQANVTIAAEPRFQRKLQRGAINLNELSVTPAANKVAAGSREGMLPRVELEIEGSKP